MKNKRERNLKTELQEIYLLTENAEIIGKLKNTLIYLESKIKEDKN